MASAHSRATSDERRTWFAALVLAWVMSSVAAGQAVEDSAPTPLAPPTSAPAELDDAAEKPWTLSLSAYTYIVPDDRDYLQTTLAFDYNRLHLEARYNYEDLDTGSVWVGWNFSFGEELTFDFTPMLGGVFGNTNGVAPGYKTMLAWRNFELYSEAQYVFDADDSDDNFFYTWSELTYSPIDWLRAGVVFQRTKIRDSDLDVEYGPMMAVTINNLDLSAYVFNLDEDTPTVVLGVAIEF